MITSPAPLSRVPRPGTYRPVSRTYQDAAGLPRATTYTYTGAGAAWTAADWESHRYHFTRNAQDLVSRSARSMVASAIRAVFEQPDEASARDECSRVIATLEPRMPAVARLLADAEPDLLAPHVPRAAPQPDPLDQPPRAAQQGDPGAAPASSGSSPPAPP